MRRVYESYGEIRHDKNKGEESLNLSGEQLVDGARREPRRRCCCPGLQVYCSKQENNLSDSSRARQRERPPRTALLQNGHPSSTFQRLSVPCAPGHERGGENKKNPSPARRAFSQLLSIPDAENLGFTSSAHIEQSRTEADSVSLNGQPGEHNLQAEVVAQIYGERPEAGLLSQLLIKHSSSQSQAEFNKKHYSGRIGRREPGLSASSLTVFDLCHHACSYTIKSPGGILGGLLL